MLQYLFEDQSIRASVNITIYQRLAGITQISLMSLC